MASDQELLRKLFHLPDSEKIFDDFRCSVKTVQLHYSGRLFVSSNFICFNPSDLRKKYHETLIIPFERIESITKSKVGIRKAVSINIGDKIFHFYKLEKRTLAYQCFRAFWGAQYPDRVNQASEILDENSELEEDVNNTKQIRKDTNLSMTNNSIEDGDVGNFIEEKNETESINEKNTVDEEFKEEISNCGSLLSDKVNHNKGGNIGEEVLGELENELHRIELNISASEYFNRFLSDEAVFGWDKFYISLGAKDMNISKWSENQDGSLRRTISKNFPVKGIPFKDFTYTQKTQNLTRDEGFMKLHTITTNTDVPYGTSFDAEDIQNITEIAQDKILIRFAFHMRFTKSCFFKNKIIHLGLTEFKKLLIEWNSSIRRKKLHKTNIKKKGLIFNNINLDHKVEKAYVFDFSTINLEHDKEHTEVDRREQENRGKLFIEKLYRNLLIRRDFLYIKLKNNPWILFGVIFAYLVLLYHYYLLTTQINSLELKIDLILQKLGNS